MTTSSSLTADTYISPAMQRDRWRLRPRLPSALEPVSWSPMQEVADVRPSLLCNGWLPVPEYPFVPIM